MKTQSINISEADKKRIRTLVESIPNTKKLIKSLEDKMYNKHNIFERKKFERYCLGLQKKSPKVKRIMNEIRKEYIMALNGLK